MQAVHDHHATYPLIKKPTNRLLLTFSPDFALNSQIWLFYAEKWIFLKKLSTLLTATVYISSIGGYSRAQPIRAQQNFRQPISIEHWAHVTMMTYPMPIFGHPVHVTPWEKNTHTKCWIHILRIVLLNVPRKAWVQAGRVWRPSDVTPMFYINTHNEDKVFASWRQSSWARDEAIEYNGSDLTMTMVWSIGN